MATKQIYYINKIWNKRWLKYFYYMWKFFSVRCLEYFLLEIERQLRENNKKTFL